MRYHQYKPSMPLNSDIQTIKQLMSMRKRLSLAINKLKIPLKESKSVLVAKEQNMLQNCCGDALKGLEKSLKKVEKKIQACLAKCSKLHRMFKQVTSVEGVGPVTASALIVATNGFEEIKTANKMACYAGVAPFSHSSGTKQGRNKVSPLANKSLKALLHMAALSVIRLGGELSHYYQRKVGEGKHKMLVLNAVRNKIIHRIYACIRDNRLYGKII